MTDVTPNFKVPRTRSPHHPAYVGSLSCCVCKRQDATQVHHIQFAQPRARGMKSGDQFTVPLCLEHHLAAHAAGREQAFWEQKRIDPIAIAAELWEASTQASRRPTRH